MPMLNAIKNWIRNIQNERLYRRVETDIPVTLYVGNEKEAHLARIKNWSPGGVLIALSPVLPLQSTIDMEFLIGDAMGGSKLKLRGQVVRYQGEDRMGVMFTDFTESGLVILREFLLNQSLT